MQDDPGHDDQRHDDQRHDTGENARSRPDLTPRLATLKPTSGSRALCISIHDVAPATWPLCLRLIQAIHAVAPAPLTLLVVPAYHRQPVADGSAYLGALERCLADGHELALHGYVHLDEAPRATTWRERYLREIFTKREGEFAALDAGEACRRIELGLAWFARQRWPVDGFVAPAWLLGKGSWEALRRFSFSYTTTLRHVHWLRTHHVLHCPSMVYSTRNAAGRLSSCWRNDRLAATLAAAPLIRLALHPADARHPALLQHMQRLLAGLLQDRDVATKADFIRRLASF